MPLRYRLPTLSLLIPYTHCCLATSPANPSSAEASQAASAGREALQPRGDVACKAAYHPSCVEKLPSGGYGKRFKTRSGSKELLCPLHHCATCYNNARRIICADGQQTRPKGNVNPNSFRSLRAVLAVRNGLASVSRAWLVRATGKSPKPG